MPDTQYLMPHAQGAEAKCQVMGIRYRALDIR